MSGEDRAFAAAGAGTLLTLWLGVEPLTGALATVLAAVVGWLTGKSFEQMRQEATDQIIATMKPRLDDFYDHLDHELRQVAHEQLLQMQATYTAVMSDRVLTQPL